MLDYVDSSVQIIKLFCRTFLAGSDLCILISKISGNKARKACQKFWPEIDRPNVQAANETIFQSEPAHLPDMTRF